MSSGNKEIVVNPLERAVSTDIIRSENFAGAMLSEFLRALVNSGMGTDDLDAGGLYVPNVAQGNPLSGEIFSGLLFTPAVGSVASVVTPGTLCVLDPDTSPSTDDSQYKQLVLDPGTSGLTLTPGSGSTRIDVIECSRVQPDAVLETDSRDVFNVVTGLFAAATVNKVTQAQLQYRIRMGTPGSGFPGTAQGWLPLAVASVPSTATVWDSVTVWDVRPLLSDRVFQPFAVSRETPVWLAQSSITVVPNGSASICVGNVEVTATDIEVGAGATYSRRRLGGRLRRGTPGTDFPVAGIDGLNLADAANQATVTAGGTNYLYLLEPFGLPRWARYTDYTTGNRQPRSPRGIPVVSNVRPMHFYGSPSSPITLPSSMGLGSTTTLKGVAILALGTVGATSQMAGAMLSGRKAAIDQAATAAQNVALSAASITTTQMVFVLSENTGTNAQVPPFARSLDVTIVATAAGGVSSNSFNVTHADVLDPVTGNVICSVARNAKSTTEDNNNQMMLSFTIPWPTEYAGLGSLGSPPGAPLTRDLIVNYTTTAFSPPVSTAVLYVNGWEAY